MKWYVVTVIVFVIIMVAAYLVYRNNTAVENYNDYIAGTQNQQGRTLSAFESFFGGPSLTCDPTIPGNNCGGGKVLFHIDSSILGGFL